MREEGRDRRAYPRFHASLFISLGTGDERALSAKGIDISRGGLLCSVEEEVEAPSDVVAMINIPGAYPIEAEAKVLRRSKVPAGWELAISFVRLREDDIPVLEQYLLSLDR
jgi:hypothetical protein